jgi:hypothetical protein
MSKRVPLWQVPYKGIEPNTPVMFLSTSQGRTQRGVGIYRGCREWTPVVEVEIRFLKSRRDKELTTARVRRFLKQGRIYSVESLKNLLDSTVKFS